MDFDGYGRASLRDPKVWHGRDGVASDALVPAEQAQIKHLTANHDKAQLEAARNVFESVAALLEENDFWTHQMGNNR